MDISVDIPSTPPPPPPPASEPISERPASDEQPLPTTTDSPILLPSHAETISPPVDRSYPKRLLPESLSSTLPHGLITGEARTAEQQAAFDARKSEILSTMTAEQIEEKYLETVRKVQDLLQEIKDGHEKVDKEVEDAKKTREMERRAWLGMKKAAAEGDF